MYKITTIGLLQFDPDLFSRMQLPSGLDRDRLVDTLVERGGEFPVLYPDPDFMKHMIFVWSSNELPIWEALLDSTELDYNPLDNYDRTDEIHRVAKSTGASSSVSGSTSFNSSQMRDTGESRGSAEDNGEETTTVRSHGNIGVTSSMDLIRQQREIVQFNVYDHIAQSYVHRFCIEIY